MPKTESSPWNKNRIQQSNFYTFSITGKMFNVDVVVEVELWPNLLDNWLWLAQFLKILSTVHHFGRFSSPALYLHAFHSEATLLWVTKKWMNMFQKYAVTFLIFLLLLTYTTWGSVTSCKHIIDMLWTYKVAVVFIWSTVKLKLLMTAV